MTKMATMPIYGKNPLKVFFSRTRKLVTLGLGMFHKGCGTYQVCSNDDPKLTLTYITSRSNLLPNAFKWDFFEKLIFWILLKPKSLFSLDMLNLMRQWLEISFKGQGWPLTFSQGRSYWSPINILKHSFLTNHWPNWTQISYEDFLWEVSQNLYQLYWSYDQDGHHTHIW